MTSVAISLLIGASLSTMRMRIGAEFLAPSLSYALFSCAVGYLHSPSLSFLDLGSMPPFIIAFAAFALFSLISFIILIFSK